MTISGRADGARFGILGAALSLLLASSATADGEASIKQLAATAPPTATIRFGADALRSGTFRLPSGKGPFPVAMLVHGGCWTRGYATRQSLEPFADALARRGIAVRNAEDRRSWRRLARHLPGVVAAVDYLPTLVRHYPLDLGRLTFVGHSAGAHLALWAASRRQLGTPWGTATSIKPRTVVAIDGPGSLASFVGVDAKVCEKPVVVPLMGATPAAQLGRYKIASPADHLPLDASQLLVEGGLGALMKPYAAAAKASGDRVEELASSGADHFDIILPSTPNAGAVVDAMTSRALAR